MTLMPSCSLGERQAWLMAEIVSGSWRKHYCLPMLLHLRETDFFLPFKCASLSARKAEALPFATRKGSPRTDLCRTRLSRFGEPGCSRGYGLDDLAFPLDQMERQSSSCCHKYRLVLVERCGNDGLKAGLRD